jgi:hypothetical protein
VNADRAALALAEKVLAILELGKQSATYKYALFAAILDLCIEKTSATRAPPATLTTPELAESVIELYWPHALPYPDKGVLQQDGGKGEQAEIVGAIERFGLKRASASEDLLHRVRVGHQRAWQQLARFVEWKLIEMPIPRLQVSETGEDRFLYEYGWAQGIKQGVVGAHQRGVPGEFDNRLNGLPESLLEEFLFGASRIPLGEVRGPLPRQRPRQSRRRPQAAADFTWERDPARSRSVAVATYSRLDEGAKVWIEGATLVGLENTRVERALARWGQARGPLQRGV